MGSVGHLEHHAERASNGTNGDRCTVDGCDRRPSARGWCSAHYARWKRLGDPAAGGPIRQAPESRVRSVATCATCGAEFPRKTARAMYCSHTCRTAPHRKDALCAGGCGTLLWTSPTSLPAGERMCRPCRRARGKPKVNGRAKRRARQCGVPSEPYTTQEIAERDGFRCGLCAKPVNMAVKWPDPASPSIDHRIPLSAGGPDLRWNVQLAHLLCNLRKRARIV